MKQDKNKIIILSLIVVVAILLGIIAYIFFVSPAINGLVVQGQNLGAQQIILAIAQQAATCQTVPLTVGDQTVILVATNCLPSECLQQPQK